MKKASLILIGVIVILSACTGSIDSLEQYASNSDGTLRVDDMILEKSLITHFQNEKDVQTMGAGGFSAYGSRQWIRRKIGLEEQGFGSLTERTRRSTFLSQQVGRDVTPMLAPFVIPYAL